MISTWYLANDTAPSCDSQQLTTLWGSGQGRGRTSESRCSRLYLAQAEDRASPYRAAQSASTRVTRPMRRFRSGVQAQRVVQRESAFGRPHAAGTIPAHCVVTTSSASQYRRRPWTLSDKRDGPELSRGLAMLSFSVSLNGSELQAQWVDEACGLMSPKHSWGSHGTQNAGHSCPDEAGRRPRPAFAQGMEDTSLSHRGSSFPWLWLRRGGAVVESSFSTFSRGL